MDHNRHVYGRNYIGHSLEILLFVNKRRDFWILDGSFCKCMDGHCPLLSWIGRPELNKNKASFFVRGELGQWRFNNKTSADSPVAFWEWNHLLLSYAMEGKCIGETALRNIGAIVGYRMLSVSRLPRMM
ncbi:hypothetical protein LINGRAPRIM_LOCUS1929 [Linum grandiflorum]